MRFARLYEEGIRTLYRTNNQNAIETDVIETSCIPLYYIVIEQVL